MNQTWTASFWPIRWMRDAAWTLFPGEKSASTKNTSEHVPARPDQRDRGAGGDGFADEHPALRIRQESRMRCLWPRQTAPVRRAGPAHSGPALPSADRSTSCVVREHQDLTAGPLHELVEHSMIAGATLAMPIFRRRRMMCSSLAVSFAMRSSSETPDVPSITSPARIADFDRDSVERHVGKLREHVLLALAYHVGSQTLVRRVLDVLAALDDSDRTGH